MACSRFLRNSVKSKQQCDGGEGVINDSSYMSSIGYTRNSRGLAGTDSDIEGRGALPNLANLRKQCVADKAEVAKYSDSTTSGAGTKTVPAKKYEKIGMSYAIPPSHPHAPTYDNSSVAHVTRIWKFASRTIFYIALPHEPQPLVRYSRSEMTPDPTRDTDTPPPAPRPAHQDPPPAPRKPRRGVRKTRRRRPRSDDQHAPPPACTVCHRRRPLRASGLCWSLACALKMAQDNETESTPTTQQPPETLIQNQASQIPAPSHRIRPSDEGATGLHDPQSPPGQPFSAEAPDEPELRIGDAYSSSQGTDEIEANDDVDRGRQVEDIERQDKDVNRNDSDDRDNQVT